jgi:hypothetical protein
VGERIGVPFHGGAAEALGDVDFDFLSLRRSMKWWRMFYIWTISLAVAVQGGSCPPCRPCSPRTPHGPVSLPSFSMLSKAMRTAVLIICYGVCWWKAIAFRSGLISYTKRLMVTFDGWVTSHARQVSGF